MGLVAVLVDRRALPAREPPVQLLYQAVQGLPVLYLGADLPPQGGRTLGIAGGLRLGDRIVVFGDAVVDVVAALREHPQEVIGLEAIGRLGRRGRGLGADRGAGRPASAGTPPAVPSDRAGTAIVGQTGDVHLVSFRWAVRLWLANDSAATAPAPRLP